MIPRSPPPHSRRKWNPPSTSMASSSRAGRRRRRAHAEQRLLRQHQRHQFPRELRLQCPRVEAHGRAATRPGGPSPVISKPRRRRIRAGERGLRVASAGSFSSPKPCFAPGSRSLSRSSSLRARSCSPTLRLQTNASASTTYLRQAGAALSNGAVLNRNSFLFGLKKTPLTSDVKPVRIRGNEVPEFTRGGGLLVLLCAGAGAQTCPPDPLFIRFDPQTVTGQTGEQFTVVPSFHFPTGPPQVLDRNVDWFPANPVVANVSQQFPSYYVNLLSPGSTTIGARAFGKHYEWDPNMGMCVATTLVEVTQDTPLIRKLHGGRKSPGRRLFLGGQYRYGLSVKPAWTWQVRGAL